MQHKTTQYRKKQWRYVLLLLTVLCFLCFFSFTVLGAEPNYVYFDLSAGSVTINGTTGIYTGYRYDGNASAVTVTGNIADAEAFYVYQSDGNINTGLIDDVWVLPTHERVTVGDQPWGDYITNNPDVEDVIAKWNEATKTKRTATPNRIIVSRAVNVTVVIDSIYSSFHKHGAGEYSGAIDFQPGSDNTTPSSLTIRTVGDNRVGNIFYATYSQSVHRLIIEEAAADSTLTVANLISNDNKNYWRAAIGANDSCDHSRGIVINSGTVFAGTNEKDDCTAIGGGGNGYGVVTINGGRVTATVASSGAAIGGGIGKTSRGGKADVTINGGEVYAYNFSCKSGYSQQGVKYIPAAAIGGGSSARQTCDPSTVTITGGYVFAQSVGGTAIGGGSSADSSGGNATITITGGEVYAKSIAGKIDGVDVPVGVAIGGGTGGKLGHGGNVTLTVSGNAIVRTGSIGGGATIATTSGYHIGNATVTIKGGDISGQIIMAEGAQQNCTFTMSGGVIHNDIKEASFIFKNEDGGAIYMDDTHGVATMSGGVIRNCSARQGGALYMTAGEFELSGTGSIQSCTSAQNGGAVYLGGGEMTVSGGSIQNCTASQNGGAMYLGGDGTITVTDGTIALNTAVQGAGAYLANGTMTVSGGSISQNHAAEQGGGAYLGGGLLNLLGGTIEQNTAIVGGGAYVNGGDVIVKGSHVIGNKADENGGGLAVNNGNLTMYGGAIDSNRAESGLGGGIYVSTEGADVTVHIRSGSVSANYSGKNGGALSVVGSAGAVYSLGGSGSEAITVTIGVKEYHTVTDGQVICDHDEDAIDDINACPVIENNLSEDDGGGIYVSGSEKTALNIYCLIAEGNTVNEKNSDSNFMKVEGGTVVVSSLKEENPDPSSELLGYGYIDIGKDDSFHVSGGKVDIYGEMSNPRILSPILADIANLEIHHCKDHRNEDGTYYSVQYFENFKQTGKYELISVPVDAWYAISGSVFYNAGYEIAGWTTDIRGYGYGDAYTVGKEYHFTGDNPPEEPGDLILYAVWNPIGYKIHFDPGTKGDPYSGSMPSLLDKKYDDPPFTLPLNQFVFKGYLFVCWSDGKGNTFTDGQEVEKLTTESEITLTAIWSPCEHALKDIDYEKDEGTLSLSCKCSGYTETLTLTASGGVYNGSPYLAVCKYSYSAVEVKVSGVKTKFEPKYWHILPTIVYAKGGEVLADGVYPVNASTAYTASITKEGLTVTVPYTIEKAEQLPPAVPSYELNPDGTMNHIEVNDPMDTSGKNIEYQMTWYNGSVLEDVPWTYVGSFSLPITFTNYYVYARYEETENYKASPAVMAEGLYYVGDVLIRIQCADGISYVRSEAEGGILFTISAVSGYYLYNTTVSADNGASVQTVTPRLEYLVHSLPTEGTVTIVLSGANLQVTVSGQIAPNQIFDSISGTVATVSRDSAFTARFDVSHYENYTDPAITFTEALPIGTTIILQDKLTGEYWFTVLTAAKTKVLLSDFKKMGNQSVKKVDHATSFSYQFIIDFSRVTEAFDLESLDVGFTATPGDALSADPWIPVLTPPTLDLELTEPAYFEVEPSLNNPLSSDQKTLEIIYAQVSDQDATEWKNKSGALVLSSLNTVGLPQDAYLLIEAPNVTRRVYPEANGTFIIPIPSEGYSAVNIRLVLPTRENVDMTYSFAVAMYVSNSAVSTSPMNGTRVYEMQAPLTFEFEKEFERSLEIKCENTVFGIGDTMTVFVNKKMKENDSIKAKLLYRNLESGVYVNTALPIDTANDEWKITLAGQIEGSYCLEVTINDSTGEECLKSTYYFVIHKADSGNAGTTNPDDAGTTSPDEAGTYN